MYSGQLTINKSDNVLKNKSYAFALRIVKLCRKLQGEQKEYVLSKQLLRSGTAIGALTEEANQAESKADFIHKLSIANKEANETQYWIRLLIDTEIVNPIEGKELLENCNELIRIVTASIKTSKTKT
jgi:four helix bundle protein